MSDKRFNGVEQRDPLQGLATAREQAIRKRAARAAVKAGFVAVLIEIVTPAEIFFHPHAALFLSKIKGATEFDCCLCERQLTAAEVGAFAFARRSSIWDEDAWLLALCERCFKRRNLINRVHLAVRGMLKDHPDRYSIVEVRLVGVKP